MSPLVKLSDYVMNFLADEGVGHVFFLPGGGAMHLNDSLGRCERLTPVCLLHEQAAAIAAEAYARVSGNLGACLVTAGPGGTNTVTGVAAAWLDSTPVVFLSGQAKRADLKGKGPLRQLGVQEIDIVSIVSPITKYAVTVLDPRRIGAVLRTAVRAARSGRPGPVWLDIPLDVQAALINPDDLLAAESDGTGLPAGDLPDIAGLARRCLDLLRSAERPVILAGNGIRSAGAIAEFTRLVERWQVPVLTTRLGVDLLPSAHPLCFGMPGGLAARSANFTLQNCDLLLVLGARLDMALVAYAPERLARGAKKVMVNIDPAEIEKFGSLIDLPVPADARTFVTTLLDQAGTAAPAPRLPWLDRCRAWKQKYPFVTPAQLEDRAGISVYAFSTYLSEFLSEGDIFLPGSSGLACEIVLNAFHVKQGQRIFHNKGTGAMGFQQPAAIAACLAAGRRPTICVDGDGGFVMNIQELETVRRLDLPIVFFVLNNGGYASIRASQKNYFGRLTGADATSDMTLPDLMKVAAAFGLPAVRLSDPHTLREDVRAVVRRGGPVVCEVMCLPDEPRVPRASAYQKPDGSMASKPLEDLYPFLDREEFRENMLVPILED